MGKIKLVALVIALILLAACVSQPAVIIVKPVDYAQYQNRNSASSGGDFLLILKENGNLYTYGKGSVGYDHHEESDTDDEDSEVAKLIMIETKQAIALGSNGMALKNDGSLWTWGSNSNGQCGFDVNDVNNAVIYTPTKLMDDVCFIAAESNGLQSMIGGFAIKNDGSLWGWGKIAGKTAAAIGQKNPDITTPFQIDTDVSMVYGTIAAQNVANVYYYLKNDNTLWACGGNFFGMVGRGSKDDVFFKPVQVLENVANLSVGLMHVLALKTDGSVWAWGYNECGQIGNGNAGDMDKYTYQDALQLTPYRVTEEAVKVVAGFYSSFALKSDGSVWGWGSNDLFEMGSNDYKVTPEYSSSTVHCIQTKPRKIIKDVTDFSIFESTGFANNAGVLFAWGNTSAGNTGTGLSTKKGGSVRVFIEKPTKVMEGVESVYLTPMTTCFIKTDGTFWLSGVDVYREYEGGTVIVEEPWQIVFEDEI